MADIEGADTASEAERPPRTAEARAGDDAVCAPGYRLALSRLRLATTRQVSAPKDAGATDAPPVSVTFETTSEFLVLADPSHRRPFPAEGAAGREDEVAIVLGEDERLQSLSVTSTGIGPRVLSAGAQLLGTVAGSFVGLGGAGLKRFAPTGFDLKGLDLRVFEDALVDIDRVTSDRADLAARKLTLERAIDAAETLLVELATAAAAAPADTQPSITASRLERELTRLHRLLDEVDARIGTLDAARTVTWRETDEAHLFVRDLPAEPAAAPDAASGAVTLAGLRAGAGWDEDAAQTARAMLLRFGVLVCVRDAEAPGELPKGDVADRTGGGVRPIAGVPLSADAPATPRLIARAPRAIEAALYAPVVPAQVQALRDDEGADLGLRLVSRGRVLVVDEASDHVAVPLAGAGLFGKSALEVTLGATGAITGLSSSSSTTGPEAVTGAVGAFQQGMEAAGKLLGTADELAGREAQGEIAELKARKERAGLLKDLTPSAPEPEAARRQKLLDDIELQRQSAALQRELAELQILQAKAAAGEG